jgi:hypothetical protein
MNLDQKHWLDLPYFQSIGKVVLASRLFPNQRSISVTKRSYHDKVVCARQATLMEPSFLFLFCHYMIDRLKCAARDVMSFTDGWLKKLDFVNEIWVRSMSSRTTLTSSQSVSCLGW